jgi:hypothetical protein
MRWLIAALAALVAGAAEAEGLVDCSSPGFAKAVGLKTGFPTDCVEIARQTLPVDGGKWTVRAVRLKATDANAVAPQAQTYMEMVADAFEVWEPDAAAVGLKFTNVTIFVTDPSGTEVDFEGLVQGEDKDPAEHPAHAEGKAFPGECVVAMNSLATATYDLTDLQHLVAHEVFHCVQDASFNKTALSLAPDSDWWVEGTAQMFASLVVADPQSALRGAEFNKVIQTTPLTQTGYNSEVFFAYLWQQGPAVMGSFFANVTWNPGEDEQMAATEKALGAEVLQGFATAWVDGTISLPTGVTFPKPDLGKPVVITDNQELPSEVEPFIIDAWAMSFVGAEFIAMDGKVYRVRPDKGGDWGAFPLEIKLKECGLPESYVAVRFVGNSIKDGLGLPITVTKMQDCVACVRLAKADQCMVGMWQLNRDDHLSWLQKQAVDMADVRFSSVGGDIFLKLDPDGKAQWIMDGFQVGAVYEPAELQAYDISIEIDVRADAVLDGEWSTDGAGTMNYCGMGAAGDYTSKVRVPGLEEDEVALEAPVEDMFLTYNCAGAKATMAYMGPAPLPGDFPAWRLDRVK